jgi:rhodanese-related sulfurtransferase
MVNANKTSRIYRTRRAHARGLSWRAALVAASLLAPVPLAAMSPDALAGRLATASPPKVVDVRANHEFETAHIPGSINVPFEVLALRQLPPFKEVVVVVDGRGRIDPDVAAAVLQERLRDTRVEVLDGGFAAWDDGRRPTTHRAGFSPEAFPAITYQSLVAGREPDLVLVDLRRTDQASVSAPGAGTAAAREPDPIAALAKKLPGARVAGDPFAPRMEAAATRTAVDSEGAPLAAPAASVPPLLVLIDNNDGRAQEVARKLIASGNRRFVILTGGIEAVRLEGRSLMERTGGALGVEGGDKP